MLLVKVYDDAKLKAQYYYRDGKFYRETAKGLKKIGERFEDVEKDLKRYVKRLKKPILFAYEGNLKFLPVGLDVFQSKDDNFNPRKRLNRLFNNTVGILNYGGIFRLVGFNNAPSEEFLSVASLIRISELAQKVLENLRRGEEEEAKRIIASFFENRIKGNFPSP